MPGRLLKKFPWPYPHFMAFAPLDMWLRLLLWPRAWVGPLYWPRLALGLFTSVIGTALTLPERMVLGPVLRAAGRRSGMRLEHKPGVVVVLGYFRSGTTHLHYLLSCDPRFRTPMWCETLAPQGFFLSWSFLRVFMIPFLSATRPQDDVAIGPEWPAEDDFAVNNWTGASSLMGRFVLPREHAYYDRFHSLQGLTERERRRWRWTLWAFVWKLGRLARGRAILLKTPSHTARVAALVELFGAEHVKFVHISREPGAVIRSNVNMASRLSVFNLQPAAEESDVRARLTAEYVDSERRYLEDAKALAHGRLSEMRYEDLVADPMAELRRVYAELGLEWSGAFEARARRYLSEVRDYRAATPAKASEGSGQGAGGKRQENVEPAEQELAAMAARFGHDRPARPKGLDVGAAAATTRPLAAVILATVVALGCSVLWVSQAYVMRDRHDWLAWPTGVLIGLTVIVVARVGSVALGIIAALLTLLVFVGIAVPATFLSDYAHRLSPPYHVGYRGLPMKDWEWYHILKASRVGLLAQNNLFWGFMGCVSAYRFASRKHVNPPGTG